MELWNTIGLSKKIFKKTTLAVQQSLRLRENATTFNSTFTEVALSYELVKKLEISINYRHIFRDKYAVNNQRIYGILDYSNSIKRFTYGIRTRFEKQYEMNEIPEKTWRNRIKISYNIPKMPLEPFGFVEGFYDINNIQSQLERIRLCFGLSYKLDKQNEFSICYINQNEVNIENPAITNIIGLEYNYKFKKSTKKEKP
jgi:Protein of unknown function (DUF2490)